MDSLLKGRLRCREIVAAECGLSFAIRGCTRGRGRLAARLRYCYAKEQETDEDAIDFRSAISPYDCQRALRSSSQHRTAGIRQYANKDRAGVIYARVASLPSSAAQSLLIFAEKKELQEHQANSLLLEEVCDQYLIHIQNPRNPERPNDQANPRHNRPVDGECSSIASGSLASGPAPLQLGSRRSSDLICPTYGAPSRDDTPFRVNVITVSSERFSLSRCNKFFQSSDD